MLNANLKIILAIIVTVTLFLYPIYIARAAAALAYILKEFVLDLIARLIARSFLGNMVNGVLQQIRTGGRDGGPAFIQNWRNFLEGSQYRGEDVLRSLIADATMSNTATICPYLRNPIGKIYNVKGTVPSFLYYLYRVDSMQHFKLRNYCSLPANFNPQTFATNFGAGGGWAVWDKLVEPQNNFFGVLHSAQSELGSQRSFEQGSDTSEHDSSGFTPHEDECQGELPGGFSCVVLGTIMTPLDIFRDNADQINAGEFDWLTDSDELEEVIMNLVSLVANRLADFLAGSITGIPTSNTYSGTGGLQVQARQDCIDACVNANCPDPLPACIYDAITGLPTNSPCAPNDPDPRQACITNCQNSPQCQIP